MRALGGFNNYRSYYKGVILQAFTTREAGEALVLTGILGMLAKSLNLRADRQHSSVSRYASLRCEQIVITQV